MGSKSFEDLKKVNEYGAEYWSARGIQPLLGYTQWRRFEDAIKRECEEELGSDFYDNFDFSSISLLCDNDFEFRGRKWTCYNYIGSINYGLLKKAKLHNDAFPEFVFVDKKYWNNYNNSKRYPILSDIKNFFHLFLYTKLKKVYF